MWGWQRCACLNCGNLCSPETVSARHGLGCGFTAPLRVPVLPGGETFVCRPSTGVCVERVSVRIVAFVAARHLHPVAKADSPSRNSVSPSPRLLVSSPQPVLQFKPPPSPSLRARRPGRCRERSIFLQCLPMYEAVYNRSVIPAARRPTMAAVAALLAAAEKEQAPTADNSSRMAAGGDGGGHRIRIDGRLRGVDAANCAAVCYSLRLCVFWVEACSDSVGDAVCSPECGNFDFVARALGLCCCNVVVHRQGRPFFHGCRCPESWFGDDRIRNVVDVPTRISTVCCPQLLQAFCTYAIPIYKILSRLGFRLLYSCFRLLVVVILVCLLHLSLWHGFHL